MNIIAWGNIAPWAEQRQVEQDLVISRAIVALFSDAFLREELRFRGGTALNKLHFPAPLRYSEDIDLVRTTRGPIKPVLSRIRDILQPWLGDAAFDQSPVAPKLVFRTDAEDGSAPLRLKVEINTREVDAYDGAQNIPYVVENPWFAGNAAVATYSREEMLATKLRALLQRDKGRDLFDLAHSLAVFDGLDTAKVIEYLLRYLQRAELRISRAEADTSASPTPKPDSLRSLFASTSSSVAVIPSTHLWSAKAVDTSRYTDRCSFPMIAAGSCCR